MPAPNDPKAPPVVTTLTPVFARLFDRDALLLEARRLGAVKRDRALHVWDVLLAMVLCAIGDEHRSIATARRQFFDLTGFMPEESSFYDRLTPAFAELAWQQFLRVLASANRVQRRRVAKALGVHVRDVRVVDASVVTLPARAAAHFPSTDSKHGGFKITATLSVLETSWSTRTSPTRVATTARRSRFPADRRGILWIADRGYSDHKLFAEIADGDGYFLVRLKTSSLPTLTKIRSGVAKAHLHEPLTPELPVWGRRCGRSIPGRPHEVARVPSRRHPRRAAQSRRPRLHLACDELARPRRRRGRRRLLSSALGRRKSVPHAEVRRSAR